MLIIFFSYIFFQGAEFWLRYVNLNHMKRYGMIIPHGFEKYIDIVTLKKTLAYTIDTNSFFFRESVFNNAVLLIFMFGGLLNVYNSWISSLSLPFVVKGTVFFLLLSYAGTFLSVPFSLYSTFKIENKYGFNAMSLKLWFTDLIKSVIISTLIIGLALFSGLWIIQMSPNYWWLFIWGFFFIFSLFIMYISPYIIEPLFNKFTQLEIEALEGKIRDMMEKAGINISRVLKIDASKRSQHTNAYFTGIGRVKRIVLFDTLIKKMDQDEILAVLAHEAGHWKHKHVLKRMVVFESLSFIIAYLSFRILKTDVLADIFKIQPVTFFSQLMILGFLFSLVSFPFTPLFSYFSRRHENEADRFAISLTSDPESLASSLIKLSKDNLASLCPHPLFAKLYYSHPPVVERVKRILGR